MATARAAASTVDERRARGREANHEVPVPSHRGWKAASDRPDPIVLLEQQDETREPDLVPVRHGRMMVSPFTFFRGAARIMAADLENTPRAGLTVQLCGDAHLSNFGAFASPERRLVFDLNDFDETLPGPFEYDVKRMAASFLIAAQNNGFAKADATAVTMAAVAAYRRAMAEFAQMRTLDIWYAHRDEEQIMAAARTRASKAKQVKELKRARKNVAKAHTRDSLQALSKLAERVDGQYRIASQPPIVIPLRDLAATHGVSPDEVEATIQEEFDAYRATLPEDRRDLLERFHIVDVARKVVGVGSVGTRAFIALLQGRDEQDPLFLQVKEATASVLEDHLPRSRYQHPGERVVKGQLKLQAASDIFLGWTQGRETNRYFYWRQLRDMKGSALVEAMSPPALGFYGELCGWTLARAHARSGDPISISEYLGDGDTFDRAMTDFAKRYAKRNELDYHEFVGAVRSGRLQALEDT